MNKLTSIKFHTTQHYAHPPYPPTILMGVTNLGSFILLLDKGKQTLYMVETIDGHLTYDTTNLREILMKALSEATLANPLQAVLQKVIQENLATPARVDADGTAKPLTRIVHHPRADDCQGPGMALKNPEYEDEKGDRTPLTGSQNPPLTIFEVIKNMDDIEGRGPERVIGCFTNNKEAVRAAYKQGVQGHSDAKVSMREVHATVEDWLKSPDGKPYASSHKALDPNDRLRNRALAKLTPEERHALGLPQS